MFLGAPCWGSEEGPLQWRLSFKKKLSLLFINLFPGLNDPDNHNSVVTHLEPDVLECEVKWALGSTTINKASGGDGVPAELLHILKDDAVKVLSPICQQIWKTQQ